MQGKGGGRKGEGKGGERKMEGKGSIMPMCGTIWAKARVWNIHFYFACTQALAYCLYCTELRNLIKNINIHSKQQTNKHIRTKLLMHTYIRTSSQYMYICTSNFMLRCPHMYMQFKGSL
jgi:hypothetical protein